MNLIHDYESMIFLSKQFQSSFSHRTKKFFAKFASMFVDQKFVVVIFKKFFIISNSFANDRSLRINVILISKSLFFDQKFVVVISRKFFANNFILFFYRRTNKTSKNFFISFIEVLILYVDFVLKLLTIDFFSLVDALIISRWSFRRFARLLLIF